MCHQVRIEQGALACTQTALLRGLASWLLPGGQARPRQLNSVGTVVTGNELAPHQ